MVAIIPTHTVQKSGWRQSLHLPPVLVAFLSGYRQYTGFVDSRIRMSIITFNKYHIHCKHEKLFFFITSIHFFFSCIEFYYTKAFIGQVSALTATFKQFCASELNYPRNFFCYKLLSILLYESAVNLKIIALFWVFMKFSKFVWNALKISNYNYTNMCEIFLGQFVNKSIMKTAWLETFTVN